MRVLLDTHVFLWFILDAPQLAATSKGLISDPVNEVLISPASYWEIAIKIRLGKFLLPQPFRQFFETHISVNDFAILHILPKHAELLTTMGLHHKDPFDRLLIAQALSESIPIISADPHFDTYGVQRIW